MRPVPLIESIVYDVAPPRNRNLTWKVVKAASGRYFEDVLPETADYAAAERFFDGYGFVPDDTFGELRLVELTDGTVTKIKKRK